MVRIYFTKIIKHLPTFLLFFIFWVVITNRLTPDYIILGIIISLLSIFIFGKEFPILQVNISFRRLIYILYYLVFLLKEITLSSLKVGYSILQPKITVKPALIKCKTNLNNKLAQVILANSITLTPGTLTVNLEGDYLYIHKLDVKNSNREVLRKEIIEKFESILKKVFEE